MPAKQAPYLQNYICGPLLLLNKNGKEYNLKMYLQNNVDL